jgi:endonuclease G
MTPSSRHGFVRLSRVLAAVAAVLLSWQVSSAPVMRAASPNVIISQVYGGGGNSGAPLRNDFIELFNRGNTAVSLEGWSVQYASAGATGLFTQVTPLSGSIEAGHYYLIQEAVGANTSLPALPPFDASGTIAMSATGAKVALVNSTAPLGTVCAAPGVVDLVGYGATACFEGSGPAPVTTNSTGVRRTNVCVDVDSNAAEFQLGAPNPRNSGSTTNCSGPTNPAGAGGASPAAVAPGGSTLLTVTVTPGQNPTSTGTSVIANLGSIGGSATQSFFDDGTHGDVTSGDNVFSFQATVGPTTGIKTLPVTIADAQARTASSSIALRVQAPVTVVISQLYGGGGNGGATYHNDYIELYNASAAAVDLTAWTLQYASATGNGWAFTTQPLGGVIGPGEYFLVELAAGNEPDGAPLPPSNIEEGGINMAAAAGKIALVRNGAPLSGNCPLGDPDLVDFVGFGTTADCHEGAANAPAPNNTTALFRKSAGQQDTDENGADFVTGAPAPRQTAAIVEIGPAIFNTDPGLGASTAPRDASITLNFTEAVDVEGAWYHITCTSTGAHDEATTAVASAGKVHVITPNVSFEPGESCTVTIAKDQVHDLDLEDAGVNTDTLREDYVWTFTVVADTTPPYPPSVHLTMGNPSGAQPDLDEPNNFLMEKKEFALSYNRDKGTPNWVSWHLSDEWTGGLARVDTFRPDPAVPPDWYRVQATDFLGTGFDRGHMTPNADRDEDGAISINQATFLMTNMVPQAPDNNQGAWADLENYLRTLLPANELYIVSGPAGVGGSGDNGAATTLAGGHVTVPAFTWKAALVIPKQSGDDVSRVSASTRTIAVIMPNTNAVLNTSDPNDWRAYLASVDAVEALSGYDLFSEVPEIIQNSIEAGVDGANPPGVADQLVTGEEDADVSFTLQASAPSSNPITFTILTPPAHGVLSGSDAARTYTPAADFNGTDSFTFRASDGVRNSNVGTVTIRVLERNDSPAAQDDAASTDEDTTLTVSGQALTSNDAAGPANESAQTLTVTQVTPTAMTHGVVTLAGGAVTYVPDPNFNGAASFLYTACDDGLSAGLSDPRCATATVAVVVRPANDPPVLAPIGARTVELGATLAFTAAGSDADVPAQALRYSVAGAFPVGATINPTTGAFTWTPTAAQVGPTFTFDVVVTDGIASASTSVIARAVDTTRPVISSITASPDVLWPPIHLPIPVRITVRATDLAGTPSCRITSVTNDETGTGDSFVIAPLWAFLIAERNAKGDGRVYTIGVTCTDASGNEARAATTVLVPHDRGHGGH